MMGYWLESARAAIKKAHVNIPDDATLEERKKAIFDAYPFGPRQYHPYKMWCRAQKEYLRRYQASDADIPRAHLSPLERMMRRAKQPPTGDTK